MDSAPDDWLPVAGYPCSGLLFHAFAAYASEHFFTRRLEALDSNHFR